MNFRSEIAKEIMDYLTKNPDAADTLEAVTEWWLLEQKIEYESTKVKEALAQQPGVREVLIREFITN